MTLENLPVSDTILTMTTKPIISPNTTLIHNKQSKADGRDISHANVEDDMIPPALSKVWQDVLPGKLNDFVQKMPEVQYIWVSDDESSEEPIAKMHSEIVINIVPNVAEVEFAIVIVSVL